MLAAIRRRARRGQPVYAHATERFPTLVHDGSFIVKDANGQAVTVARCGTAAIGRKKASDRAAGPIEAVAFDWRDFAPPRVSIPWEGLMKKLFAGISALTIMAAFSANAADLGLPITAQPQPAYSWTGCYLGVHGGGGAMQASFTGDEWGGGGLAGGQIGCNYQIDHIVIGVEAEGWWSGLKTSTDVAPNVPNNVFTDETVKNRWDFDVALRAGFAWDRALLYGKAGMALGRFNWSSVELTGNTVFTETASARLYGLLLGVGGEYAFSPNWSAKLEYDFIDYFAKSVPFTAVDNNPPANFTAYASQSATKQIVKVGLNYRFTP
jgi:outer membrane immunogenic protein